MQEKPKERYATYDAIMYLAEKFNYSLECGLVDWEYIVADRKDLPLYFEAYDAETDDDVRFLLMKMIIETSSSEDTAWIQETWPTVKQMLKDHFDLHAYSVYYWCFSFSEDIDDMCVITPSMRELWKEITGNDYIASPESHP